MFCSRKRIVFILAWTALFLSWIRRGKWLRNIKRNINIKIRREDCV